MFFIYGFYCNAKEIKVVCSEARYSISAVPDSSMRINEQFFLSLLRIILCVS
jgi:hypothetical protein